MPKEKKRLSKTAKAAQKILNDSKLLANAKASDEANVALDFKPTDTAPKLSTANKPRPDKKRG